jgi:hypothetical protein
VPPMRPVHTTAPVLASTALATPASVVMKSRSSTSSTDGLLGTPRVTGQASASP